MCCEDEGVDRVELTTGGLFVYCADQVRWELDFDFWWGGADWETEGSREFA